MMPPVKLSEKATIAPSAVTSGSRVSTGENLTVERKSNKENKGRKRQGKQGAPALHRLK